MSALPQALGGPLGDALASASASAAQQLQVLAAPASDAQAKAQALSDQAQQGAGAAEGQGTQALSDAQSQVQQTIQAAQQAQQVIQAAQGQAAQAAAGNAGGQAAQAASTAADAATDQIADAFNPQQLVATPGLPCACSGHIPPAFDGATAALGVASALAGAAMGNPTVQACLSQASALAAFAQQVPADLPAGQMADLAQQATDAQRAISQQLASALPAPLGDLMQANNVDKYGDALGPTVDSLVDQGKSYADIVQSAAQPVPDPQALASQYGDALAQQGDAAVKQAMASVPAVPAAPALPEMPALPAMPSAPALPTVPSVPSLPSFGR